MRRAVFLLLGAVLALPYTIAAGFVAHLVAADPRHWPRVAFAALVIGGLALVPAFLSGTRELEITAARALLGVGLPGHDRGHRMERETRLRSALWFGLHLVSGVLVGAVLLIVVPVGLIALTGGEAFGRGGWWWLAAAPVILAGAGYAVAGLGSLAATMAPILLGPSASEREHHLAERNRLARELHDSIGHALTAMTLQAGAARAVFDSDPEFARQALTAIEETGRAAAGELDAVLGLLRDEATGPTLTDLDQLLTGAVQASVTVGELPVAVSREAYRIVQESLTNAARHGTGPVTLRIRQEGDLMITVTNRRGAGDARPGGHGIAGMRERARLLGGRVTAGPDGENWRVTARLPVRAR
ncbi:MULTISPECIES: sensor histidine kinase [unclassified Actinoplanes]|uniref:sensor histidine kinase n=1 Tax=unclassified Actinoplanes TaxID=2626549 RepID=UPI0002E95807|nr:MULTISPECIES: histidine kinase [unclassified Actinoplanes]